VIWPFAQNPSQLIPRTIAYDLVIQEAYPGVCFLPVLMPSAYFEMREVGDSVWFVTNAMWNPNLLQWEQDLPADPASIATAFVQAKSGTWSRYIGQPTVLAGTQVTWVRVYEGDEAGHVGIAPLPETGVGSPGLVIAPTWTSAGALQNAFEINVTDNSSNSASSVELIQVNSTPVWEVRKDGTLVVGHVPVSAITGGIIASLVAGIGINILPLTSPPVTDGFQIELSHGDYVDLANVQTITGVKEIAQGTTLRFGPQGDGTQADTGTNVAIAYGAKYQSGSFVFKAENNRAAIFGITDQSFTMYADSGLTPGNTYAPTPVFSVDSAGNLRVYGDAQIDGNTTMTGKLTVTGKSTFSVTEIDGNITLGDPAVNTLGGYFVGLGHALISITSAPGRTIGIDTSKLALLGTKTTGIVSNDGSLLITKYAGTQMADLGVSGGGLGSAVAAGSNPSPAAVNAGAVLKLPALPAGTWFVEAMAGGFGLAQGDNTKTCVLDLDGSAMNTNGSAYERFLYMFESVTSTGTTTPQVTLTGVGVVANGSGPISLSIKAVRTA